MSESPIRFATIARRLSVPVDQVEQWAELPGGAVVGVFHPRLQHPHVGVEDPVREIHRHVIVLIGVTHNDEHP